jgi:hypothetical protein
MAAPSITWDPVIRTLLMVYYSCFKWRGIKLPHHWSDCPRSSRDSFWRLSHTNLVNGFCAAFSFQSKQNDNSVAANIGGDVWTCSRTISTILFPRTPSNLYCYYSNNTEYNSYLEIWLSISPQNQITVIACGVTFASMRSYSRKWVVN